MAFEYRFNVIRFYSKLNRFVLSPRKKPNHFVLKIRPGGFADYNSLFFKLVSNLFSLYYQLPSILELAFISLLGISHKKRLSEASLVSSV